MHFPFDLLQMKVILESKTKIILTYCKTLESCIDIIKKVFGKHSMLIEKSSLSTQAKMLVQLCAEIVSFEIGASGYPIRGPITKCLLNTGIFSDRISFDFLNTTLSNHDNQNDSSMDLVRALTEFDVRVIQSFRNGINPSIWNFNDPLTNEPLSQVLASIIKPLRDTDTIENEQSSRLDLDLVEKTRSRLKQKLFVYEKNSIEKDLSSWMILVSSSIMTGIRHEVSTSGSTTESVFDVIDGKSIVNCILDEPAVFMDILEGLADIFLVCYEWEYKSDMIGRASVDCKWPRNLADLAVLVDALKNHTDIKLNIKALGTRGNHGDFKIGSISK